MLDVERVQRELQMPSAAPLHGRLRSALQSQINDGTLKAGDLLPPERSLQDQLGISRSTVRQALRSLIEAGAVKSVVGAGTFVLDQRQASHDNHLIGIIIPDSNYYVYYPELASSLSFRLRAAGYRVDLSIHNDRYEKLAEITDSLLAQHAVAVIVTAPSRNPTDALLHDLRAKGLLVMLLTRSIDNVDDIDYIDTDNERIGYEATSYLVQLGHTGIVYVGGTKVSTAVNRGRGYIRAMQEAALQPRLFIMPDEPDIVVPAFEPYEMSRDPAWLWERITRRAITAAFCFNDDRASWVQKEIRNLNLAVPHDFSLVGVDDMPYANFFDAPLSTFALPGEAIGEQAANLLLRRLNGETSPPQRILLPARFIQRASTAAPPQLPSPIGRETEGEGECACALL
ncbi:MAG TPA: substrate-binding domain-containing protein [Roseiflexaceae bacterium]|jgi:DNA-binding LacI/PurR family transcriptional regulator|nr:substrate-binding domain-containing protein [Roseiflexaceae bacterium]